MRCCMPSEKKPFRLLSEQEFQRLSTEEHMQYLRRAMADIREKLELTRKQANALKKFGKDPSES
jgi:hypothetical protein